MQRRHFLNTVLSALPASLLPRAAKAAQPAQAELPPIIQTVDEQSQKLLQQCRLAGFQYHYGEALWSYLAVGQQLHLQREPENIHDERAVRVEWHGKKLGYLPRLDNAAVSQLLDRGETVFAVITELRESSNPWERIGLGVMWEV